MVYPTRIKYTAAEKPLPRAKLIGASTCFGGSRGAAWILRIGKEITSSKRAEPWGEQRCLTGYLFRLPLLPTKPTELRD